MKTKNRIIHLRVDETIYGFLRKEALQKDINISELVRDIIITWYFAHDFIIKDIKEKILKK